MSSLTLRGKRVFIDGALRPATLTIRDGRIASIAPYEATADASPPLIDAGDLVVSPGVVDTHVHINEPGRTEWEGFATATQAAAAGGITTVMDMPLNCIPATTSLEAAETKKASLEDQRWVNVGFWGGVIPGNADELPKLARFGCPGAKCFLVPSGVDEFPHVTRDDLDKAMPVLREQGMTLLVHAELPGPIEEAEARLAREGGDVTSYARYLASRPNAAEDEAIALMIELCRKHGTRVHIVHLSSASALPLLEAAHAEGLPISAETCLHYLTFTAEEIEHRATHFKCAPPIREGANREKLFDGLFNGTLSLVVSDHSPCTPQLKCSEHGDFERAWGGISSLQLGLSALYTQLLARGKSVADLVRYSSEATAELAGLGHRKGRIKEGYDADLVLWDDARAQVIEERHLRHRHKVSPYLGRALRGVVAKTLVGGHVVFTRDVENPGDVGTVDPTPRGAFVGRG